MRLQAEGKVIEIAKSTRIGAHKYAIRYPYAFREIKDVTAQAAMIGKEIRLRDTDGGGDRIDQSELLVNLLHELFHVIERTYCGNQIMCLLPEVEHERFVDSFSEGLAQVLLDNVTIIRGDPKPKQPKGKKHA